MQGKVEPDEGLLSSLKQTVDKVQIHWWPALVRIDHVLPTPLALI